MHTFLSHRLVGCLLLVLAAGVLWPLAIASAASQKRVLVLYSTRHDAQISAIGDRELPRILQQGLGQPLDIHSEYLDVARFPDETYQADLSEFLAKKYKALPFDLVIATQDVALDFVVRNRTALFPNTPVVFFGSSGETQRVPNSTGVVSVQDLAKTIGLALQLQPETRQVFVVSGADRRDAAFEAVARTQFRAYENQLAFTYLTGLASSDLYARLATLPERSIIYYLVANRDGKGESVHPLVYLDRLAAVANAPIYCWVDSAMDHGIVGGSLKSQRAQTEAIGQLAVRVLRGEPADRIAISSPNLHVDQVDWRQLRRWGITETRVPPGTMVMFREPSAWDRYKIYVFGAAALILAQTVLITGLLVQSARRRRAEQQARGSQEELRKSYDRIRDLGARLLNAQDDERARVARELHDDISQQVAFLAIDLELLRSVVQEDSTGVADEAFSRAQQLARSVHDLSYRLHPAKLRLIGLVPALNALQREFTRADFAVVFAHRDVPSPLSPEVTLCLFRVVQEALQNAIKYSKAREVFVHLRGMPKGVTLTIVDHGVGFDVDAGWAKGLGLISMAERLEAIGGTLRIRSSRRRGTRLHVTVPVPVPVEQSKEAAAV